MKKKISLCDKDIANLESRNLAYEREVLSLREEFELKKNEA